MKSFFALCATLVLALASGCSTTAQDAAATPNQLTAKEKAAGWKLLFDGQTLNGWSNFKKKDIKPGWQAKDGMLVCVDPKNAGDIVTAEKFGAFELQLDFRMGKGANSGIIYHVTEEGGAVWATGPEIQLEDNEFAADAQKCGWLYSLYQPPIDGKTGKTLDTTKPAGEWNHLRVVISPDGSLHEMNGTKYVEYVIGSDDFNNRVKKSKFGTMPKFAKSGNGFLAIQGDHGEVAFKNIKIRPLTVKN